MSETTPTRDEAVPSGWKLVPVEPTEAMMDAAIAVVEKPCFPQDIYAAMLASAPAPASGRVDAVGVCGISADTESKRVLKLHFKHEVTDADRKTIIDAFNTLNRERRSALSTAATPVSEGDMRAFGASEHAAYKWPDDTPEHRAARAAFCEGAALAKPASSPASGDVVEAAAKIAEAQIVDAIGEDDAAKAYRMACHDCADAIRSTLSQSTSAGSAPPVVKTPTAEGMLRKSR